MSKGPPIWRGKKLSSFQFPKVLRWLKPLEMVSSSDDFLEIGRQTMRHESEQIELAAARLGDHFRAVVDLLATTPGKVVVCGIGKSGHIGRKIVASLCSAGTPAVFLHPTEAVHGDLGLFQPGDPAILISKSGSTGELHDLLPVLKQMRSPIVAMVGNADCELAKQADFFLDTSVTREADPFGILPTASSTVTLAIGDALAAATMKARGFTPEDFARFHPSGQLGRNLTKQVADILHQPDEVAQVGPVTPLRDIVIVMTKKNLGAACVLDPSDSNKLVGIITDGDVRRALQKVDDIRGLNAADVMTADPITVLPEASLAQAVSLMEDRPNQISELPVVNEAGKWAGLIRIHDIYQR